MSPDGNGTLAGWQCSSYRYPAVDTSVWAGVAHYQMPQRVPATGTLQWTLVSGRMQAQGKINQNVQ